MVLTGEPGCGKSAAVCNWIQRNRVKQITQQILIYHFIGCAKGSIGKNKFKRQKLASNDNSLDRLLNKTVAN